jgi:hypothetical protein
MRWALLAPARSRTSPTDRLRVLRSTIAEISSPSRVASAMKYAARAFRPKIDLVGGAHDGDDDPVRASASQVLSNASSPITSMTAPRNRGQSRANAVAFQDGLGAQRPYAFDIPRARGSIHLGAGLPRHLRRAGADIGRCAAHRDRLSRFTRTRTPSATR